MYTYIVYMSGSRAKFDYKCIWLKNLVIPIYRCTLYMFYMFKFVFNMKISYSTCLRAHACVCVPCRPPLATRHAQQARAPSPRAPPHSPNASLSYRTTFQCAQVSALEWSIRLDEREHAHEYMCRCVYVHAHTHTHISPVYITHTNKCVDVRIYICTYLFIYIYICIYTYVYIYILTYTYVAIHTYIHTYMHTLLCECTDMQIYIGTFTHSVYNRHIYICIIGTYMCIIGTYMCIRANIHNIYICICHVFICAMYLYTYIHTYIRICIH
jgi:hypothetical protein